MKGKGAQCQVEGCDNHLPAYAVYYQRYHICAEHASVPQMERGGRLQRFCQQCGRFHDLDAFDGLRKTCRRKLQLHNAQRKRARDAARAAASAPTSPATSGAAVAAPQRRSYDAIDKAARRHTAVFASGSATQAAAPLQAGPSTMSSTSASSGPGSADERALPHAGHRMEPPSAPAAAPGPSSAAPEGRKPDPALAMSMDLDAILGIDLGSLLDPGNSSAMASTGMLVSMPPTALEQGVWQPAANLPSSAPAGHAGEGLASASAVTVCLGPPIDAAAPLALGPGLAAPPGPAASLPGPLPRGVSMRLVQETSMRMFGVPPMDLPAPLYSALMSMLKTNFFGND